jgi:hypothetical protein
VRPKAIVAPHGPEPELDALVDRLRRQGQIVVRSGPGRLAEGDFEFDREIRRIDALWQVVERGQHSSGSKSAEAGSDGA